MDSAEINVSFYNIIYEKKKDYLLNFNHKVASEVARGGKMVQSCNANNFVIYWDK